LIKVRAADTSRGRFGLRLRFIAVSSLLLDDAASAGSFFLLSDSATLVA
jgi:hypothetical protein